MHIQDIIDGPHRRRIFATLSAALAAMVLSPASQAAEIVRVGGTGAGLAAMRLIGDQVKAVHPEIQTEVLPSLGTSGGIRALSENAIQIAVALRAPNPTERQAGLQEGACATTALVFASSHPKPPGLTRAQLPGIYSAAAPTWSDGTPLRVILRSRDGSENPYLVKALPGMESAFATAYRYAGIPVGATDQENADLAQRTEGSLAVITLLQLRAERLKLAVVALDGIAPGSETLANESYPMPIRLCLFLPASPSSGAARFIAYVKSAPGKALLRGLGAEPSE